MTTAVETGIDLADLAFWRRPPHERERDFARLRALAHPVFFPERRVPLLRSGAGFHALVRHADVVEASRNAKVFSSEPAVTNPEPPGWVKHVFGDSMVNLDDPRHARLRRIVSRAFSPKMLARLDSGIAEAAARIVDDVVAQGPRDFVAQVAARLPITVICDMMGIPGDIRAKVHAHVDASTAYTGVRMSLPRTVAMAGRNMAALFALQRLVIRLGREREREPGDDLVSALVTANVDGERLTPRELGSFFTLLLVAGNETARNTMAHGLKLLTGNPGERERLAGDFEGHIGGFIEETVRYVSPIMQFRRTVTEPYEMRGVRLSPGDKVVLFYGSANRDEEVFPDAGRFDITRKPNPHVGFGGPGPHFCLGANLARQEIKIMYRELFTRLPGIRTVGEPDLLLSNFDNSVRFQGFTF
ncbi:methyl-branched lipid omega-hydroxylase [Sphaerisporangium siamense]|uniref:Cytochrome P450 n=1 Tax=Sphaerisporangium siamense TaxID=795645 RepID=A0A7W7DEU3_9ACTN|nr:cytochrome P450 [Sphaerisporangium siamense]MBB4704421.1 cytochrome P450 [Sphaerisporangium siamense]GII84895.1 methyl-branched lipid omega-hydroxylase [Sphaerisporangium siamense]